jgi:hypothetical protein
MYTNIPVVNIESNEVVETFTSVIQAQRFCANSRTIKVAFDRLPPDIWVEREMTRLRSGLYVPVPKGFSEAIARFNLPEVAQHFLHSSESRENVAFTKSHEHGVLDRQTVLKPGRYLQQFYSGVLNENEIREIASKFTAGLADLFEIKICYNREAFKFAYLGGEVFNPSSSIQSCMGKPFAELPCHPAEVYAGGDLAIAYITDSKNLVIARAVIYPEKKVYAHIYTQNHNLYNVMEAKFKKEGYSQARNLVGARLLKVPYEKAGKNMFVMPHIDTNDYFIEHPDSPDHFLVVDYRKSTNCASTIDGYMRFYQ